MSRQSDQHYLHTHHQLQKLWHHAQPAYGHLTPTEQWQLHDYFQPTKQLTDPELISHRAAISTKRPTLPQQAGKALTKLYAAAADNALRGLRLRAQPRPAKYARQPRGRIAVYGVVRPEPTSKPSPGPCSHSPKTCSKCQRSSNSLVGGAGVHVIPYLAVHVIP